MIYLIVLGCLLLSEAFHPGDAQGTISFIPGGEEQAAKGYFFHVMAGLLAIIWNARGSRSKFPMAFAAISCTIAGTWTYIAFTPTFFGLSGLIPGAICGILFGYRIHTRNAARES